MSRPTKSLISKILNTCKFNPRVPGPLRIISDVGNTDYYMNRAIEFIEGAKHENQRDRLLSAIALLALAIANEET